MPQRFLKADIIPSVPLFRPDSSGGGGIRTHGWLAPSTVFKTVPIDHSGTPPQLNSVRTRTRSLADLVDDILGHVDGHVDRDGHGDGVAGPGVDLDDLAVVAN